MIINKVKQTNKKLFITSFTDDIDNIKVNDYVKSIYNGEEYSFKIAEIEVVRAAGYRYKFIAEGTSSLLRKISYTNEIDLLDLMELELFKVTNNDEITKIREESGYI